MWLIEKSVTVQKQQGLKSEAEAAGGLGRRGILSGTPLCFVVEVVVKEARKLF